MCMSVNLRKTAAFILFSNFFRISLLLPLTLCTITVDFLLMMVKKIYHSSICEYARCVAQPGEPQQGPKGVVILYYYDYLKYYLPVALNQSDN